MQQEFDEGCVIMINQEIYHTFLFLTVSINSLCIAPTRDGTHFLKNIFVVAGGGIIPIIYTKGINKIKIGKFKFRKRFKAFF